VRSLTGMKKHCCVFSVRWCNLEITRKSAKPLLRPGTGCRHYLPVTASVSQISSQPIRSNEKLFKTKNNLDDCPNIVQ
jgi:hypothetical protein